MERFIYTLDLIGLSCQRPEGSGALMNPSAGTAKKSRGGGEEKKPNNLRTAAACL